MRKIIIAFTSLIVGGSLFSCIEEKIPDHPNFLEELRTSYFDQLNFNDEEIIDELPTYLVEFTATYDLLETKYKEGEYTFEPDLENMNLVNFYYSSLLTAVTKAYLDGNLSFEDIIGNQKVGLFSFETEQDTDLERVEMRALASRAVEVAELGKSINGENDRSKGAYLAARHVYGRLTDPYRKNNEIEQQKMIEYAEEEMEDYEFLPVWNLLMSMVYFDNYEDESNTFNNPEMEVILDNVIDRMQPEDLPTTNDNHTSVLVGIYQMDIVMKKVDWMIQQPRELSKREVNMIKSYVLRMNITEQTIIEDGVEVLARWEFLSTFKERQNKVAEIENYMAELKEGKNPPKPNLAPFFQSKNFRQAYQCYSCHKSPDL